MKQFTITKPTQLRQLVAGVLVVGLVVGFGYIVANSHAAVVVGDLNNDGVVNVLDLSLLLSKWGTNAAVADLNSDGTINVFDLSMLLSHWQQTGSASPTPSVSPTTSPSPTATPTPSPSASPTSGIGNFGIATGALAGLSSTDLNNYLAGMKTLGVGWVRYDIEWDNIEPQSGVFDWSDYDRVVQAVAAHGLNSVAILDYAPSWAAKSGCDTSNALCAPASPSQYAAFAAAAAARYKADGVTTWEIWNEENTPFFYSPGADPTGYTAILRAAYTAIKQVEPGATILTGGLAPAGDGDGSLAPTDFVTGMYAAGAQGYFDALGDHPYTYPDSPAINAAAGGAWAQMSTIHSTMAAHGDGSKKIWITEYGAPTNGPDPAWYVSETAQAQEITSAVQLARGYGWVGAFFCYTYLDPGISTDTNENFFGLVRADGSHKPSYAAYRAAMAGG